MHSLLEYEKMRQNVHPIRYNKRDAIQTVVIRSEKAGAGFLWFGLASCSTGRCSGPSTLIYVVGKRNLNGINVYLR